MNFEDIKTAVEELCDGRSLGTRHVKWIERVRYRVAMSFIDAGFRGLYFLYQEAIVTGGSIADEPRYAVPTDFIDDLNVWYADKLLSKAPPGMLDITLDPTDTADEPTWVRMMGQEFDIRPIPTTAGDVIKLLYNATPALITLDATEDYFMKHFPDLHIFGMGEKAALYLGDMNRAKAYKDRFTEERVELKLHNRRHHFKNAHIRFQNWDEFEEKKTIIFPQFANV